MTVYKIYGAELSPYSVKVRSYFRFKGIPHQWLLRSAANRAEFEKYARLPLVPLVITPQSEGLQDSTPILERIETESPEPTILPSDPALRFVSALIEEYADEWGNKAMFHYRWWRPADQQSAAARIARTMLGDEAPEAAVAQTAAAVIERMVPRLSFVGSSEENRDLIEGSFGRQLEILAQHLENRPYLLGGRPSMADFGWWGQIYNAWTDPTPSRRIAEEAPGIVAWIERMLDPGIEGSFESWSDLAPTLGPLLQDEIGGRFLPWSVANAKALAAGEKELEVELDGHVFRQQTQKYHARSLAALRGKYEQLEDRSGVDDILRESGCLEYFRAAKA